MRSHMGGSTWWPGLGSDTLRHSRQALDISYSILFPFIFVVSYDMTILYEGTTGTRGRDVIEGKCQIISGLSWTVSVCICILKRRWGGYFMIPQSLVLGAVGVKIATGADITAGAAAAAARSEFPWREGTGMAGGGGRPPRNANMSLVDMGAARTLLITCTFTLLTSSFTAAVFWLLVRRRY